MLGLALLQPAASQTAMPAYLQPLQGTWVVASAEQRGMPLAAFQGARLTIGENSFELQTSTGEFRGKFRISLEGSPRLIDFRLVNGDTWRGIFTVTARLLRIHYVDAAVSSERPALFSTSADAPGIVLELRK